MARIVYFLLPERYVYPKSSGLQEEVAAGYELHILTVVGPGRLMRAMHIRVLGT